MAELEFTIKDEDGTDEVIFDNPQDWSPEPVLQGEDEMVVSCGSWDDDGNELPPVYTPHVSPKLDTGAELFISGDHLSPENRKILQAKWKAGLPQLYYDADNNITYTVYITPKPEFKFIPGSEYCIYTIRMKIK